MNRNRFFKGVAAALFLSTVGVGVYSSSAVAAETQTPKEAYIKYHAAMLAANKIEDLQQYLCKRVNKEINETPSMMRPMMFGFMKAVMQGPVKIESEKVNGDSATLSLLPDYSKSPKADPNETGTGSVTLIKEDGSWKIDKEKWDFKSQIGGTAPAEKTPAPASN